MKKLKIKKILLLFSMVLAMVGCFLVKGVSVKASDDFIWSLDTVGTSNKDNIVFTEYIEEIDKVVCVTSNSSICFLDYEKLEYSEEITISDISTSINQYQICVCGVYLMIYDIEATKTNSLFNYIKINLKNLVTENISTNINVVEDGNSTSSICSNDDKSFYISYFSYGRMYDHTYIYKYFYEYNDKTLLLDINKNGLKYLTWADSNSFYVSSNLSSSCDKYNKNSGSLEGNSYARKGYEFDNFTIFEPTQSHSNYFMILKDNSYKDTVYKALSTNFIYLSFRVNNSIYIIPQKQIGSIEALTINNFELSGERKLFCKYDKPQSYQDILSNYTPSDLYGRDLMMTLKADSYYNSFSTPGNYDATITVSDGYCHEDFAITIVVNKGGGEEEKKESSGSSIKWDSNLMIQSFGGIAVFLVIGLLVVTIIKKILR